MISHSNLTHKSISILIFVTIASFYFLPKIGYFVLLTIALSLIGLFSLKEIKKTFQKWEIVFIGSFVCYFLLALFNVIYFDINFREIDNASRFILVLPIFLYLRKFGMSTKLIDYGLILACLVIGINGVLSNIYELASIPIASYYGESLYAGTFGVSLLFFASQIKEFKKRFLYLIPALFALFSSFIAMGRGALMGTFLSIILIVLIFFRKNKIIPIVSLLISLIAFSFLMPVEKFRKIEDILPQTMNYFEDGAIVNSSLGHRFEMWKSALIIAKNNHFQGIGVTNYKKEKKRLIENNIIDPTIEKYNHPHSEILSSLVNQGVMGLASLMLILWFPIVIAVNSIKSDNESLRKLGILLFSIGVHYLIYAIGNATFYHQHMTIFYAYFVAISLGIYSYYSKT